MTPCEDHDALDHIAESLQIAERPAWWVVHRESECVEFYDKAQDRWYEIVVRPIDGPSREPKADE